MKILSLVPLLLLVSNLLARDEVTFTLKANQTVSAGSPVSIDLTSSGISNNHGPYQLLYINKGNETNIPSQVTDGAYQRLCFLLEDELKAGQQREYLLKRILSIEKTPSITLQKDRYGLQMIFKGNPILNYQFNEVFPPDSINPIYRRSGFIHPLWSPQGEVLTRIQPPDHYHHYGLWGPWTKTHIGDREVDFWNLYKGQGTVRFSKFVSEIEGPVFSGFSVLQEHMDFGARGQDQVAINELLNVRAWKADPEGKIWLIDYTTTINTPLDSGIMLDAYRYGGGIGMRATEKWHKDNCTVLTSEGHNRSKADGSKARWCIIEGESVAGRSGVLLMSHPSNRAFPEPMRVWPENGNQGRGDMFFEFCPIRHDDWPLEKGRDYTLRYRLVVFDGQLTPETAEKYWQAFATPPYAVYIN